MPYYDESCFDDTLWWLEFEFGRGPKSSEPKHKKSDVPTEPEYSKEREESSIMEHISDLQVGVSSARSRKWKKMWKKEIEKQFKRLIELQGED